MEIESGWDNLKIYIPAAPKMKEVHVLRGKFAGLVDVQEMFDSEYEAKQRLSEYALKVSSDDCGLEIAAEKVAVQE